jgi:hypothetical protein
MRIRLGVAGGFIQRQIIRHVPRVGDLCKQGIYIQRGAGGEQRVVVPSNGVGGGGFAFHDRLGWVGAGRGLWMMEGEVGK